jgi:putative membrane protein
MDRRGVITIFAMMLAAPGVALARHRARREEGETSQGGAGMAAKYAEQTLAVGTVALETSKLAQNSAKDDWVRRFANYEVAEQTTIADVLKSMGMKPPKSDEAVQMVDKLKNSSNFDADYLAAQLDGHQKLLKIQEDYIQGNNDAMHVGIPKLARTQIKEHIDLIQTLQKNVKA